MSTIVFRWTGDGIARITAAVETLAGPRKEAALRRAVNHTGDKTFTQVRRTLAKQMGLASQKLLTQGRTLVKRPATGANLEFQIVSRGKVVRAKEFRHRIGKQGITFYPWGVAHNIRSAFVVPRWGGNFYRRRTKARFPLEALYGPNINKELVKDATAAAFLTVVAASLPARVEHEVRVITNGVVT